MIKAWGGTSSSRPTSIPKVLIGMPFGKPQLLLPHQSWTALAVRSAASTKYIARGEYATTSSIAFNRQYLAEVAIKQKCDWCLMIDSDLSYPDTLLDTLMSYSKDVIGVPYYGGVYTKKGTKIVPILYDYDEGTDGWIRWCKVTQTKLFKVDAMGGGIILVKTRVFERLKKPWFLFNTFANREHILPEDVWFCERCREAGVDIWQDPSFGDDIQHWHVYGDSKKDCSEGGDDKRLPTPT